MGIGWQIYTPNMDLLASFNSSVSLWPSSTRTELTAVASLIVTLPVDSIYLPQYHRHFFHPHVIFGRHYGIKKLAM